MNQRVEVLMRDEKEGQETFEQNWISGENKGDRPCE